MGLATETGRSSRSIAIRKRRDMESKVGTLGRSGGRRVFGVCGMILAGATILFGGTVYGQEPGSEHGSLAEIGHKLSNPVSDVWAMYTEFDLGFSDGNVNLGNSKIGGRMIFQPILPFPLAGEGAHKWQLISRPTIPVLFSEPLPKGLDEYAHVGGLGNTQVPIILAPPSGNWVLGVGPTWLLPTATRSAFGRQQWGVGPAFVAGYKTKQWIGGVFPQYTWAIGGSNADDKHNESSLNMLYFYFYNLPNAWQIGFNPTVTYNARATSGNRWNVPVGLTVSKMTKIGKRPVKLQFGVEYSVVRQDTFGQQAQFKLNIIPLIPSLVRHPLF
jgi:hypothetical protein